MIKQQKKISVEEELLLRRSLTGCKYLEMNRMLNGLYEIDSTDLNNELKTRIKTLYKSITLESVGVDEATEQYVHLMECIHSYRWVQRKEEMDRERNLLLDNLFLTVSQKINIESVPFIENGNIEKVKEMHRLHEEVLNLLLHTKKSCDISMEALGLLRDISYSNILESRMLLNNVRKNISTKPSNVYIKVTQSENDNSDFSVILEEDDEYYMVSFDKNGSMKYKDPVTIRSKSVFSRDEYSEHVIEEKITSKENNYYYESINEQTQVNRFNEKGTYLGFFAMTYPKAICDSLGVRKKICLGIYGNYCLTLEQDILKIEKTPSFNFLKVLTQEEEQALERYKNIDFLVSEIEKQMSYTLKLYKERQMALKRNF